ncbi:MAG: hypothetical protein P8J27_02395 [Mariniblastus sp.]|nr:hypothetical protein [Mariniblastus sp.]
MIQKLVASVVVLIFVLGSVSGVSAHDVFQDVLKEVYTLKSFSCKGCHPDGDDRKIRTPFADRIYEVMKDKNYSEKFAVAVKADEAAEAKDKDAFDDKKGKVAEFEKMIAADFKVSFKKVAEQKVSFDDMIKQGLFYGARLDTKKLEAKAAEAAAKK